MWCQHVRTHVCLAIHVILFTKFSVLIICWLKLYRHMFSHQVLWHFWITKSILLSETSCLQTNFHWIIIIVLVRSVVMFIVITYHHNHHHRHHHHIHHPSVSSLRWSSSSSPSSWSLCVYSNPQLDWTIRHLEMMGESSSNWFHGKTSAFLWPLGPLYPWKHQQHQIYANGNEKRACLRCLASVQLDLCGNWGDQSEEMLDPQSYGNKTKYIMSIYDYDILILLW